jgi:hypothetical protein
MMPSVVIAEAKYKIDDHNLIRLYPSVYEEHVVLLLLLVVGHERNHHFGQGYPTI